MGHNDHIEDDGGYNDFLQQIIDGEHLEGASLGIVKQVIDRGVASLSDKQKYVFETQVLDEFTISECSECGGEIPWSEMYVAAVDTGMCSYCAHMVQKDD